MNAIEQHHVDRVAQLGCVVCRRVHSCYTPAGVHHIAKGSGLRSWFCVAPLCGEHHQGGTGLHGLSAPVFCLRYRVPGEDEYGLLVWVNEDLAMLALGRLNTGVA